MSESASDDGHDHEGDEADEADEALAATLPDLALLLVFEYVADDNLDDLVSAGQVCRHWRRVAARAELWRGRRLKCHGMATQAFTRVMAFAPRLLALDVCWINQISPEDRVIRKQALLGSRCALDRLTGVMCHRDSAWTQQLLEHHAAHLKELEVGTANREALHAVANMPRLRALHISGWDPGLDNNPYLHPQRRRQDGSGGGDGGELDGLERLAIRGLPRDTTISLLQAHGETLKKLTLNIGTPCPQANDQGWPKTCNDLPQVLHSCNLNLLQDIILTRYVGCRHTASDCILQRKSLKQLFPFVKIECTDCTP